nr:MAG: plasmid replication protein [Bacteriophage sp.]
MLGKNIDKNCENIFWYIFSNIDENSNIIKFNIDDINNNYNKIIDNTKAIQHLIRPINNIIDNTNSIYLLAKTNIKNLYVVNHNIIFKGNYNCFIDLSKEYNNIGNDIFDKNGNIYYSRIAVNDNGFNIDIRNNI